MTVIANLDLFIVATRCKMKCGWGSTHRGLGSGTDWLEQNPKTTTHNPLYIRDKTFSTTLFRTFVIAIMVASGDSPHVHVY